MERNPRTSLPMLELLKLIVTLIRSVLQGTCWQDAFRHNGYAAKEVFTSTRIKANLIENVVDYVATEWPSDEAIANMLPRRRKVNYALLKDLFMSNIEVLRPPNTHERSTQSYARSFRTRRDSLAINSCVHDESQSMTQQSR